MELDVPRQAHAQAHAHAHVRMHVCMRVARTCEGPRHAAPMQNRVLPAAFARSAACKTQHFYQQIVDDWYVTEGHNGT